MVARVRPVREMEPKSPRAYSCHAPLALTSSTSCADAPLLNQVRSALVSAKLGPGRWSLAADWKPNPNVFDVRFELLYVMASEGNNTTPCSAPSIIAGAAVGTNCNGQRLLRRLP